MCQFYYKFLKRRVIWQNKSKLRLQEKQGIKSLQFPIIQICLSVQKHVVRQLFMANDENQEHVTVPKNARNASAAAERKREREVEKLKHKTSRRDNKNAFHVIIKEQNSC